VYKFLIGLAIGGILNGVYFSLPHPTMTFQARALSAAVDIGGGIISALLAIATRPK